MGPCAGQRSLGLLFTPRCGPVCLLRVLHRVITRLVLKQPGVKGDQADRGAASGQN
jgi:hypothetical protein